MSSRMSLAWTGSSSAEPLYKYCITCRVKVKVKMNVDVDEISDKSPSFLFFGGVGGVGDVGRNYHS